MLLLDSSLRFAAITLLVLMAILSLRDARQLLQARIAAALCISLAAMLLNTAPVDLKLPPIGDGIAWLLHIPNTILLWWFALSLFDDDFRLKPVHWAVFCLVFVFLGSVQAGLHLNWDRAVYPLIIANRFLTFAVLMHLFWSALKGQKDDLVEARRRTRLLFVVGSAIAATLIIGGETIQDLTRGVHQNTAWFSTVRVILILPMILFGTLWFLSLPAERFLFEPVAKRTPTKPQIDPRDAAIHRRLLAVMEDDHVYREHGLSIGDLATRLSVPEHQLRGLINQGMGFRNFSAFLNHYRLADAKTALADPEQARTPILTIALDAGYASLATFNRAFRTSEGQTPSEFRANALSAATAT